MYEISLDPDRQPQIVRYRASDNVILYDGEPLTGVSAFRFGAVTGEGIIAWWKERPVDRDYPEGHYVGSRRRTSQVCLILHDASGLAFIAPATSPPRWCGVRGHFRARARTSSIRACCVAARALGIDAELHLIDYYRQRHAKQAWQPGDKRTSNR